LELETLKSVLSIIEGTDIVEVEVEEGGRRVRVRRAEPSTPAAVAPAPAPLVYAPAPLAVSAPVASPAPAPPPAPAESAAGLHEMKSPIVGTFYQASDPGAAPFVKVGDTVRKGQVLCIVEAMKLMNEIESDVAGEIVKIHPENGHPVQFGEPLFTIKIA